MSTLVLKKMSGGLNNQKMILLALIIESIETNKKIRLPEFVNYVNKKTIKGFKKNIYYNSVFPFKKKVDLFKVFDRNSFSFFLKKYNVDIEEDNQEIICQSEIFFFKGSEIINNTINNSSYIYRELTIDFFKHLIPSVYMKNKIDFFTEQSLPYEAVCQLRIEDDWPLEVEDSWAERKEKITTSQIDRSRTIFKKIKNTLPEIRKIYVTYDKNGLQCTFEEIASMAKNEFAFELKEKKYLSNKIENPNGVLEASIIDFEIAVSAKKYIGTNTSSFSSLSALTVFCRNAENRSQRYLYNIEGANLILDDLNQNLYHSLNTILPTLKTEI